MYKTHRDLTEWAAMPAPIQRMFDEGLADDIKGLLHVSIPLAQCYRFLSLNLPLLLRKETLVKTEDGMMMYRHCVSWIQPFPGEVFNKSEICWAMYAQSDDANTGSTWFRPKGMDVEALQWGMEDLVAEDLGNIVSRESLSVREGHDLLRPSTVVYKAMEPHERSL